MSAADVATPIWRPGAHAFTESGLARFALANGFDPHDYRALHQWSVTDRSAFWNAVWDFAGVIGERGDRAELLPPDQTPGRPGHMFGTRWYPHARLNFAENLLRGDDGRRAVVVADEGGVTQRLNLGELKGLVAGAQQGLRRLGVGQGDIVAGILPNGIDNLVAYLATVSLGAAWAGCPPDFGVAGLIDRIGQVQPKVLVVVERYTYNGRVFDISDRIAEVVAAVAAEPVVVVSGGASWAQNFVDPAARLGFTRFAFDNPLLVMFTSGTTGLPKCIVHGTGGVLLQHLKEHLVHGDVRPGDTHSWYTSTGWMMYGWVVSVLAAGASVLLVDGAPAPRRAAGVDHGHLWRVAEDAGVTHFGTSPRYLGAVLGSGYRPRDDHRLGRLRAVLSSGAPVTAEQVGWVYDAVASDLMFASISGGTDIHGCFMLGSPLHPVYPGEISCLGLGMAVAAMDAGDNRLIGEKGDLVCTEPFPSMPLTFLGPGGLERYHDAYFAERDDIWTHGDLIEITDRGTVIVYGRGDATLNPSGVRIGTAEIYRVLERRPEVVDSIAFGYVSGGNEEVAVLVVLADGVDLTDELASALRGDLRAQASPRHVPRFLLPVSQIPYTANGKKVETAARAAAAGQPVRNIGSIANPDALREIAALFPAGGPRRDAHESRPR